jgi:hypothetical protein
MLLLWYSSKTMRPASFVKSVPWQTSPVDLRAGMEKRAGSGGAEGERCTLAVARTS